MGPPAKKEILSIAGLTVAATKPPSTRPVLPSVVTVRGPFCLVWRRVRAACLPGTQLG